jgi:hypothetical protein
MKEDVKTIVIVCVSVQHNQYPLVIKRVYRYLGGMKFVSCVITGCGSQKNKQWIKPAAHHITQ